MVAMGCAAMWDARQRGQAMHLHVQRPPALTMPARVQKDADAMCGTATTLSQSSSPGLVSGSSSNTSRPALPERGSQIRDRYDARLDVYSALVGSHFLTQESLLKVALGSIHSSSQGHWQVTADATTLEGASQKP